MLDFENIACGSFLQALLMYPIKTLTLYGKKLKYIFCFGSSYDIIKLYILVKGS